MFKANTIIIPAGIVVLLFIAFLAYTGHQLAESSTRDVAVARETGVPIVLGLQDMRAGVMRIVTSSSEQALLQHLTVNDHAGHAHTDARSKESELVNSGQQIYAAGLGILSRQFLATQQNVPPDTLARRRADMANLATVYSSLLASARELSLATASGNIEALLEAKEVFEESETATLMAIERTLNAELSITESMLADSAASTIALGQGIDYAAALIMLAVALLTLAVARLHALESRARLRAERNSDELSREIEFRKQAETQLVAAQKLSGMGTLLGGIAHSINNHLVPILSLSQLLGKSLPPDSADRRDAEMITDSARSARKTLGDVLAFARGTQDQPTSDRCEAIAALRHLLQIASKAMPSAIAFNIRFEVETAWVGLTSTELENLALNLLSNARDALAGQPGRIDLIAQRVDGAQAKAESPIIDLPAPCYFRLEISDTGSGIAPEVLPRLFDPFFTTKEVGQGTGLGLAVSYGIAHRAGGTIAVRSEPGKGSCFAVLLPVVDTEAGFEDPS